MEIARKYAKPGVNLGAERSRTEQNRKPRSRTMIAQLLAIGLGSHIAMTVADKIPSFDVEPSCRQAESELLGATQDKDACLKDENNARDQIERTWSEFSEADRNTCVSISSGWHPTYTELLTCLELFRDARQLRAQSPADNDTGVLTGKNP